MKTQFLAFVPFMVLLSVSEHSARAQSTAYFDRGTFLHDAQNVPGIPQSISSWELQWVPPSYFVRPQLTIGNVTFSGHDIAVSSISPGELALYNFDSSFPLGIHFANGARAFGADFSSYLPENFTSFSATLSLNDGESFSFTAPSRPNSGFFGFISPTPISDVTFSDGGIYPMTPPYVYLHEELIANVYVVHEIPELGSALLLLAGCLALWACRRRI